MERICSVGMNPRVTADWSARLVMVSVVKTLPIDLSEVAYIAIEPLSPPGGSETGFLHKISVERQRLSKNPVSFVWVKGDRSSLQKHSLQKERSQGWANITHPTAMNCPML